MGLFSGRDRGRRANRGQADPEREPQALVRRAQGGDADAREELIRAFRPFVMRVAADACGRFVGPSDDEASVALIAFDEAITVYQPDKGGSFLRFAETVIRRRLIDHFRKQQSGRREVPLSDLEVEDDEGGSYLPVEAEAAVAVHQERQELVERQEEIARYRAVLAEFGISFQELAALSPKHRDARASAKRVARAIAANPSWVSFLMSNRSLPLRELEQATGLGVSRKTIERNRKYIVAVALLLIGDFEHLRVYVAAD